MESVFAAIMAVLFVLPAAGADFGGGEASTSTVQSPSEHLIESRSVQSVQIGSPPAARPYIPNNAPLDRRVSIRMREGSLQTYFGEMSRQSRLTFFVTDGLADCRISAFLDDLTAREALQLLLEVKGITYQQLGRSDTYTVTFRGPNKPVCYPKNPSRQAGKCAAGQAPISIECKDGTLSSFGEILHDQSKTSLIVWDEAVDYPIDISFKKLNYENVMAEMRKNESLVIRSGGTIKKFATFALAQPKTEIEPFNIQRSTHTVKISPNGVEVIR